MKSPPALLGVAFLILLAPPRLLAGTYYDDCIISGMKGVSSDLAAKLVATACKRKAYDERERKRLSFGVAIDSRYYGLNESPSLDSDGLYSQEFENRHSSQTIAYVVLSVSEVQSDSPNKSKYSLESFRWSRAYYYKLALKPGRTIRLKFPRPETEGFNGERFVTSVYAAIGREARLADSARYFDKVAVPELDDPLE